MSIFQQYLASAGPFLHHYGYFAVGLGIFAESVGLPLPGETLLVAAAVLASQGHMNPVILILTAWATAVMGDNLGYWIGRKGGRPLVLKYGIRIGITERRFNRVERFLLKYGRPAVAIARFVIIARQLNGLVAGAIRMPWWQFFLYNCIGALLWVSVWGLGVFFFGRHLIDVMGKWQLGVYVLIGVAVLLAGIWGYRYWRRNRTG
jgi:membrane protein DedA with SNARE-associated domain